MRIMSHFLSFIKRIIREQEAKRNEDIEAWAEKLAKDICDAGEDPYPITTEILNRLVEQGEKWPDLPEPEDDEM